MDIRTRHRPDRSANRPHRPPASLSSQLAVLLLLLVTGPAAAAATPTAAAAGPVEAAEPVPHGSAGLPHGAVRASGGLAAIVPSSRGLLSMAPSRLAAGRPAPSRGSWPLLPRPAVVAGFDPPVTRWSAGHRGVDLAGSPAARVHSSLPGTVTFAGRIAGRGVVVVSHGGTRTTYEPVAARVAVGDRVRAGAVIGRLQLFGSHCFPRWCLHWGLIEGRDRYLDPLTLVGAAPVRLLPLGGAGLLGSPPAGG